MFASPFLNVICFLRAVCPSFVFITASSVFHILKAVLYILSGPSLNLMLRLINSVVESLNVEVIFNLCTFKLKKRCLL